MSENNIIAGTVDLKLVKSFFEEWSKSGFKGTSSGKPPFSFAAVGLREGVKLYVSGKAEPIGEIDKRPEYVRNNPVKLYKLGTFPSLDAAAFEYKRSIGTPVKKGNGWKTFFVKLVVKDKEAVLPIRTLWDRWPNVGENLSSLVEEANKPQVKATKESAKDKLIRELQEKNALLESKLSEKPKPTRVIKK